MIGLYDQPDRRNRIDAIIPAARVGVTDTRASETSYQREYKMTTQREPVSCLSARIDPVMASRKEFPLHALVTSIGSPG